MSNQTVFRLPSKGAGYESLKQTSEAIPKPQAHEVLLEVYASTLNYRDLAIANGVYPFPVKNDVVPLSDGAGIIIEIGSAVDDLEKGDWAIVNFDITNQYDTLLLHNTAQHSTISFVFSLDSTISLEACDLLEVADMK